MIIIASKNLGLFFKMSRWHWRILDYVHVIELCSGHQAPSSLFVFDENAICAKTYWLVTQCAGRNGTKHPLTVAYL